MRQDQYERLQKLEEQLLDVFMDEADPASWPGYGMTLANVDKSTRGDRYWCKRNAAATAALSQRITSLVGRVQASGLGTTAPPADAPAEGGEERDELEAEVASAEREAMALLDKVQRRTNGR
jgi:hypothetical protein